MAFEFQESAIISICIDCAYFNAYDRLDDQTMEADPKAAEKHRAKIAAAGWRYGTEFTPGCGRDCEEHGFTAVTADFPHIDDWRNANPGATEEDYNDALEAEYEESQGETDEWFSWSSCDECGSTLGGTREHATAWTYKTPAEIESEQS